MKRISLILLIVTTLLLVADLQAQSLPKVTLQVEGRRRGGQSVGNDPNTAASDHSGAGAQPAVIPPLDYLDSGRFPHSALFLDS
ncbi:MAG: hypothetical protein KAT58_11350 [candidate division Zixibacteria bacterium]|nr:hypothetical protein [candidate division Zixibacteria bacterium]